MFKCNIAGYNVPVVPASGLILWGPLELPISGVSASEEEEEEEEGIEGEVGGPEVRVRRPSCSRTSEWSPGWM